MFLTNSENLNSISNIFQETYDFLALTDPLIICIYLKPPIDIYVTNVPHPKLLKCDLVQTLSTFRNLSLQIFATGKASLVFLISPRERK